jgi:ABC-type sugar transport system substrate-binding protein
MAPGDVDFNTQGTGELVIETALKVLAGEEVEEWVLVPAIRITKENCKDYPPMKL